MRENIEVERAPAKACIAPKGYRVLKSSEHTWLNLAHVGKLSTQIPRVGAILRAEALRGNSR